MHVVVHVNFCLICTTFCVQATSWLNQAPFETDTSLQILADFGTKRNNKLRVGQVWSD